MAATDGVSAADVILAKADKIVDAKLQTIANGVEDIHDAILPPPPGLSNQDTVVYHSEASRLIDDVREQIKTGLPFTVSLQNITAVLDALIASKYDGGLDDRLLLLEHALEFLSKFPRGTPMAAQLQDKVISLLWYDLPHPPASLIGRKYQYRSADGYGTSLWNPEMGRAGSAYARSVQTRHPLPANQLPSPELIFDTLLKREDQIPHPSGLSSLFFAFANLVIHSLFSTDHLASEPTNQTSSYLDLSPLYGNCQEDQDGIRLHDGTGRIYPDTFADNRLLRMPPSSPALLVIYSRNHNYIVERLLDINERGIWSNPPPADEARKRQQDDDLFQTARLVNCGWFMSTIFGDYLAGILGLVRDGNPWSLDPLSAFRGPDHQMVDRGSGNVVSIEFGALYHFHSSISTVDEKWAEEMFRSPQLFGDKPWDDITIQDYKDKVKELLEYSKAHPRPPNTWTFGGMKRDTATGKFPDADLAKILHDATTNAASAFKARGTPHAMRVIEIMAIQQNREWGCCSLNEFRKFLGLKPYATFEEWNPRQDVADAARRLYRHPDNIELYVGLQAEESKVPGPGAGLCPGFTMSRAILADAVALVRGDRFLTSDFTSFNLTAWGFHDCQRNPENSAHGGVLGKLLLRTLPDYYSPESSYTNFPLVTPDAMNKYFLDAGLAKPYSFDPPRVLGPVKVAKTYAGAQAALGSIALVSDAPDKALEVLPGRGYLSTLNKPEEHAENRRLILEAFTSPTFVTEQVAFLEKTAAALIKERSYTIVGIHTRSVNIVRDVLNILPVQFVSSFVMGLPLKTPDNPMGSFLDEELHFKLRAIYNYVFLDSHPDTQLARQPHVRETCINLAKIVEAQFITVAAEGVPFTGLVEAAYHLLVNHATYTHEWLQRLHRSGKDRSDLTNSVVALGVICSTEFSQALTHVVDAFLDPAMLAIILPLARSSSPDNTTQLRTHIAEVLRLHPPVCGTYRRAETDVDIPGCGMVKAGDRVYISYTEAQSELSLGGSSAVDAKESATATTTQPGAPGQALTAPQQVNTATNEAPTAKPLIAGELVQLLGTDWLLTVMVPVIRAVFSINILGRAPGTSGRLLSMMRDVEGTQVRTYLDKRQFSTPWSSDMTINYID